MKIVLANLPWINTPDYIAVRAGSRWPHVVRKRESLPYFPFPFSLAYAAALLRDRGHAVSLKDCIAEEMDTGAFVEYLTQAVPEVVVYETSTPSIDNDLEYTRLTKRLFPRSITVLCGQHATALPQEVLREPAVDYVMLGEYEQVLLRLVEMFGGEHGDPGAVAGIGFRRNGKAVVNERAPLIADLDALPFPLREGMPMEKYVDGFCKFVPNAQMITSRGCPYQCIFCLESSVFYGQPNYRKRSAHSVVDEMELLVKQFHAREIYFDDSSFTVDQGRVRQICGEINRRGLTVAWSCMADAALTEETVRMMKQAHCIGIKFGVESADEQILKNIGKHVNIEQVKNVVKLCRRYKIQTHATYAFGLPGETGETIRKTIRFAFSLPTDTAQFSLAVPYPGTRFFALAQENKWLVEGRWQNFDGQRFSAIEYPHLSGAALLRALKYCRKRIIIKTLLNPAMLLRYVAWIWRYVGPRRFMSALWMKLKYLME